MTDSKTKISKTKAEEMFRLGYRLAFDTKSKKKRWEDIFALWYSAATNGHLRSQFYVGTCYDFGHGVKKNVSEAFDWYMKAAKKGKMEAQYNIGFFYKQHPHRKQNAVYTYPVLDLTVIMERASRYDLNTAELR